MQPLQRFAHGRAAHAEIAGDLFLADALTNRNAPVPNGVAQALIDKIRARTRAQGLFVDGSQSRGHILLRHLCDTETPAIYICIQKNTIWPASRLTHHTAWPAGAFARPRPACKESSMTFPDTASQSQVHYRGLRDWLDKVQGIGELLCVNGAHWNTEMGSITQMLTEKSNGTAPAILFDEVPGYAKGYRTLYGHFSSTKRVALTLGLPLQQERKVDIVQRYHHRMQNLKTIAPRFVKDGPVLQNVLEGDAIDVLKFPVPLHHEQDKSRYIGTACCVMTQDPDDGWFNLGAYRAQVYDGKTVGCQITEGKHGRIHRDKNFERGKPMKVAIVCGQDPLLFLLSSSPLPAISELDIAGGLRGEPIDVIRGPYTGFPIPADAEIVLEGETVPGQVRPEGPFGEWMGYYSDDTQPRPYVNVKTILYRNDPILCCAPQHKPVDETGLLKGIAGAAQIWSA